MFNLKVPVLDSEVCVVKPAARVRQRIQTPSLPPWNQMTTSTFCFSWRNPRAMEAAPRMRTCRPCCAGARTLCSTRRTGASLHAGAHGISAMHASHAGGRGGGGEGANCRAHCRAHTAHPAARMQRTMSAGCVHASCRWGGHGIVRRPPGGSHRPCAHARMQTKQIAHACAW
jgi:hypothetical protein